MALDIAELAESPIEAPVMVDRPPISVLGIRRRYWEMMHGWNGPALPQSTSEIDTPGRVA